MIFVLAAMAGDLRIEDLSPCQGSEFAKGTRVTVHYTGSLEDGTVFDTSIDRGPATFALGLGQLIEGWEIGMQGMSPGCKRRITVPPELGYGDRSRPKIPANSVTVYEIELLSVDVGRVPPDEPRPMPEKTRTETGLQYFDSRVGTGSSVRIGDRVTVEYTLWLADGTLVDSSFSRTAPLTLPIGRGRMIPGFEEAVQGMNVGGVRQVLVPWKLGYGRRGAPPRIPKKTDLRFEIELLKAE